MSVLDPSRGVIRRTRLDLADRPFIVIWEVTRACQLACRHCRAEAAPGRDPDELSLSEARRLMDQVRSFGSPPPLFILTGGDPFQRPDLFELVRYGASIGLPMSVSPSGTPTLTESNLRELRSAGAIAISLSLDGATAETHDGFRGVQGVFDWTVNAWETARRLGFKVQINTTVTPDTLDELPATLTRVREMGAMTWSVFFLVPMGRGSALGALTPDQMEDVLHFLYDADKIVSVKTTEGAQFRRVVMQRRILEHRGVPAGEYLPLGGTYRRLRAEAGRLLPDVDMDAPAKIRRPPLDVNAGRGFVFVSHIGAVHPSGFLPITAGNVRFESLSDIYRNSPLFVALRDPDRLAGRCGACEFRTVCGGSRSRAFGLTGDPLAEEPWCSYEPGSFPFQDEVREMVGAGSRPPS